MYIDHKDWSNEPRQEQAVWLAVPAAVFIFAFLATIMWAAEKIGSLF